MNWIKKIFGIKPRKKLIRRSNIRSHIGNYYDISVIYRDLTGREDIFITSVSITKALKQVGFGHSDEYLILVSYDYFE